MQVYHPHLHLRHYNTWPQWNNKKIHLPHRRLCGTISTHLNNSGLHRYQNNNIMQWPTSMTDLHIRLLSSATRYLFEGLLLQMYLAHTYTVWTYLRMLPYIPMILLCYNIQQPYPYLEIYAFLPNIFDPELSMPQGYWLQQPFSAILFPSTDSALPTIQIMFPLQDKELLSYFPPLSISSTAIDKWGDPSPLQCL